MFTRKFWILLGTITAAGVVVTVMTPTLRAVIEDTAKDLVKAAVAGVFGGLSAFWARFRKDNRTRHWILKVVNPPKDRQGQEQTGWKARMAPDHIKMLYAGEIELFKQRLGTWVSGTAFFSCDLGVPLEGELPKEGELWSGNGHVSVNYSDKIVTVDYSSKG